MIPGSWRFLEVVSITGFLFFRSFWKQNYEWTDLMPLGRTAKHSFSPAVSLTKPSDRLLLLLSLKSGIFKIPFLLFCWVFICLFLLPPRCIWWYSGDLSFLLLIEILLILCSLSSPGKCVLVLILSEQHQTSLVYVELDWLHYGSLAKITDRYEKGYFKVHKEQWGWRDPLDISDNKNPSKVLKDKKKSLGFCACRREAVPGEKSEWRPPNTRIRPDFYFPHFASQICCCTLWMKKCPLWLEVTLTT